MKRIYGVPLWLMKKYLTDLGGVEAEENVLWGEDWQATIRTAEPVRLGSLRVGRIEVEFLGEEAVIEALLNRLHWKTLRGGG